MPKKVLLAPPENIMVQAENLVKIYKSRDVEVMALQGLDLTVERGELMGIVGASGSGKSTLLNMLGGLDRPSAGSLYVDGVDMLKFTEKDFIEYKRNADAALRVQRKEPAGRRAARHGRTFTSQEQPAGSDVRR